MKLTNLFTIRVRLVSVIMLMAVLFVASSQKSLAQGLDPFDRDNAKAMLDAAREDLKKNYYDPSMRGIDMETRFKEAEAKIKAATTRDQLVIIVAQTLLDLNDSHTFLLPPSRAAQVQYGWEMQIVGERAFVKAIKPKSDAEALGLKLGDEIMAVDGYRPTRDNIWKMYYRYYALMPSRMIRLAVQSPGETQPRQLEVPSKIVRTANVTDWGKLFFQFLHERRAAEREGLYEVGSDLFVWRLPTFVVSEAHIDEIMGKTKNFKSLVIDLRGNGGGYLKTLERLTGYFFDHDVKIADEKGRKQTKPSMAKTRGSSVFTGQLIVLVDSESASASEIFARVVQLEKRGTVIGDRTAGAVMTSNHYDHQTGVGNVLYYGTSITIADTIMSDGKSLEKTGVVPDVVMIPEGADLAAKRDLVLSRAAKLAGVELAPEKAGTLFPKVWLE